MAKMNETIEVTIKVNGIDEVIERLQEVRKIIQEYPVLQKHIEIDYNGLDPDDPGPFQTEIS